MRPLSTTWSRSNRIHQSLTLSCHLLQIRRITWTAAQPDRPAGLASKTKKQQKKKTGYEAAHSTHTQTKAEKYNPENVFAGKKTREENVISFIL